MAKAIYEGINGVARKTASDYIGVNGIARKITNGYIGVAGVAREFWSGGEFVIYDYGNNPYGLTPLSQLKNRITFGTQCISLIDTSYIDYSGYPYVSGTIILSTDTTFTNLPNLDDYSEIVLLVDTKGLNTYSHLHLGAGFTFNTRWACTSGTGGKNYASASVGPSNGTSALGIRKVIISLTDDFKNSYKSIYQNSQKGPMNFYIASYYLSREGEDYDEYSYKGFDIYGIYLK